LQTTQFGAVERPAPTGIRRKKADTMGNGSLSLIRLFVRTALFWIVLFALAALNRAPLRLAVAGA
jgi:hypothetical protein